MTYYRTYSTTVVEHNPFTEYAAAMLRQRHGDPRIISCSEQLLDCDFTVSGRIEEKVHLTFPMCEIDRICLVNAPEMYGMYLLRKEELQVQCSVRPNGTEVQELELFHVTTESKGKESLKNGLDWRRTRRSKYGRGVSFSDDADYANYYANNTSTEDDRRVIIVCAVLVSNTWRVNNNRNNRFKQPGRELIVAPGTCDTTVSPNGRVFVKYYDYEFYPLYMVYYRGRPEHVEFSRYNNNRKTGAAPRYSLAEIEKRQRDQEERDRRQKEEQLQRHREMLRKQQEFRSRQEREKQQRLWQSLQLEQQRREELARSRRHSQHRRHQQTHRDNSCHIL